MKSLLIVSSFLVISIASLFSPSEINVTFDTPSAITSGESFIMDIEIDKGDISDFAKLQLSLPEGFSAELFEGNEGTFTFYDQKIKLIWISLPSDPKLNVKIKIGCDTSLTGDYNFKGKISYVLEGERKNKELVSPTIKVNPKSKTESNNIASNAIINNQTTSSSTTELSCLRSFDATNIRPGETFLVTLKVKKSNVSGVGKIIENIPNGFTAKEIENNGAIFSQKDNQVKFLWMTLPSDNEFTVSYKIMVDENLDGNKVIDGKMSYLDGDITKNTLIDGTSIEITNVQQDIQTAGSEEKSEDETLVAKTEKKETQKSETVEKTIASNEKENSTQNESNEINQNSVQTEVEKTTKKVVVDNTIASNEEKKSTQVVNKPEENNTSSKVKNTTTTQENNSVDNTIADNEKNNIPQNETSSSIENTNSIEKEKITQTESKTVSMSATNETASNHKVNYRVQYVHLEKRPTPTTSRKIIM